jgi:O-antigen/teichoic acid export membrane protein
MTLGASEQSTDIAPAAARAGVFGHVALAAFGFMGARIASAAFGFLSQLLLARAFPAAEVGVAFLAISIATFMSLVLTLGYNALAFPTLARYRALGRGALVESFLAAARRDTVGMAVVALAGSVLAWMFLPSGGGVTEAVLYGVVAAVAFAAIRLNNANANSQRRFALSYVPDFVGRAGLMFVFVVAIVAVGPARRLEHVLAALVLSTVLAAIAQAVLLGRDNVWRVPWPRPQRAMARYYRGRAMAMLVIAVVAGSSADLAVMLAGTMLPTAEVAVLGVAVRLAALAGFFGAASQPFVLRDLATTIARSDRGESDRLLLRTNLAGLGIMVGALVFCAGFGPLVLGLFGPAYVAGYSALLLFLVGQTIRVAGGMNSQLLALGGHQVKSASTCLLAVLLLLVLSLLLAPRWGIVGFAVATLCAELLTPHPHPNHTHPHQGRRADVLGLLSRH